MLLAEDASQWQIYFARDGQWSNSQSTGNLVTAQPSVGQAPPREALPEAVRLQVTLGGQVLTRDIALGPAGS